MQAIVIIAVLVVAVVVYKIVSRKRVMSPEQFIEAVRQRILTNHANVSIKSADGFDWTLEIDGQQTQVFLNNTYARYTQYPAHFNMIVDHIINSFSTHEDTSELSWEDAKRRLFPCLKPWQYLEDSRQLPGGADAVDKLVVFDYDYNLKIIIAVDSETTMSFVNLDQLKSWGISKDELLRLSIENLSKLTAPHWAGATELAQNNGIFAFATHDGYDASRILLPDFYERASRALGSENLLVGIPNRDFIAAIPANAPWKDNFQKQVRSDAESYDHAILPDVITLSKKE